MSEVEAMARHPLFGAFRRWCATDERFPVTSILVPTPYGARGDDTALLFLWACFLAGAEAGGWRT